MWPALLVMALFLLTACDGSPDRKSTAASAACGLAALAGPTSLLQQFATPGQTLSAPPRRLPERLVARVVAGPAYPAIVGRTDSLLVIGVQGALPSNVKPGYGILVMDPKGKARGLLLYEGAPVEGAPEVGTVTAGNATVPMVGIQVDPAKFEDPRCPLFPDSVIR